MASTRSVERFPSSDLCNTSAAATHGVKQQLATHFVERFTTASKQADEALAEGGAGDEWIGEEGEERKAREGRGREDGWRRRGGEGRGVEGARIEWAELLRRVASERRVQWHSLRPWRGVIAQHASHSAPLYPGPVILLRERNSTVAGEMGAMRRYRSCLYVRTVRTQICVYPSIDGRWIMFYLR